MLEIGPAMGPADLPEWIDPKHVPDGFLGFAVSLRDGKITVTALGEGIEQNDLTPDQEQALDYLARQAAIQMVAGIIAESVGASDEDDD